MQTFLNLVLFVGLLLIAYRVKQYLEKRFQELKGPKYKCFFHMEITIETVDKEQELLTIMLENKDIVLPFVPLLGMSVSDTLNPMPEEMLGTEAANKHDFKSFRSGKIISIEWDNFLRRFTCNVAPLAISEANLEVALIELRELGWNTDGLSKMILNRRVKSQ